MNFVPTPDMRDLASAQSSPVSPVAPESSMPNDTSASWLSGWRLGMCSIIAACSILSGFVLVYNLVTPKTIDGLDTNELLGMVGLMILPVVAGILVYVESRTRASSSKPVTVRAFKTSIPFPIQESAPAIEWSSEISAPVVQTTPGSRTGIERHRRRAGDVVRAHAPTQRPSDEH